MTIEPTEIVALRHQWNAIVERFLVARIATWSLLHLTIPVSAELHQILAPGYRADNDASDGEYLEAPAVGANLTLSELYRYLGLERHLPSNTDYYLRSLREQTDFDPVEIASFDAPSFDGWLESELLAVRDTYRADINALNMRLREMHTEAKQINKMTACLPGAIRSRVTGFFAGGDAGLPFSYDDDMFSRRALPIAGRQWLAPIIGLDQATAIEHALEIINKQSAPRPGEPDTLDYHGSHISNDFDLFADAEPEPAAGPRL